MFGVLEQGINLMKTVCFRGVFGAFIVTCLILCITVATIGQGAMSGEGKVYFVCKSGSNGNPGTIDKPFLTIQRATDILKAGDKCLVRAGTYHENVKIKDIFGTTDEPISITAYPGEEVVLDGTESISSLQTSGWSKHSGSIYKCTLSKDIWQLFVGDEMMISARWPNARYDDRSVWQQDATWAHQDKGSGWGAMVTKTEGGLADLAATGKDFTGAIAVLNIGNFMTHSRAINAHSAGSNTFTYDADYMDDSILEGFLDHQHYWQPGYLNAGRYFLEAHLNCLDSCKEWYFNPKTKELYFWSPNGKKPEGDIRGKTIDYAIDVDGAEHLVIRGFDFFGCTFRLIKATHCTVEDCDLSYFSYNKRMLGVEDGWNRMYSTISTVIRSPNSYLDFTDAKDKTGHTLLEEWEGIRGGYTESYNTIRNCTFAYCDGGAFAMCGKYDQVDNVLLHDIDWTGVGFISVHLWESDEASLRRLTAYTTGASEFLQTGNKCFVELCDFGKELGIMQNDGSAIQVSAGWQDGAIIKNCWVHDNEKFGIRADYNGVPGEKFPVGFGFNATFHHNVCWNQIDCAYQPVIWVGGDRHKIYNNLSYDNRSADITVWAADGANKNTIIRNNAAGKITGERWGKIPVASIMSNNFIGDVWSQVCDKDNRDFRPKKGSTLIDAGFAVDGINDVYSGKSPDIGPYEYGCQSYWIPGYQSKQASQPIPADKANNANMNADLIWLEGYKALSYDVYFGADSKRVQKARRSSKEFKGNQENNIFSPGVLKENTDYYWRIDAITIEGVIKGDLWSFRAKR